MRISDWSSDVCSSDLAAVDTQGPTSPTWARHFKIALARCFSTIFTEMPQRCATSALLSPSMRLSRKTVRHLSGSCRSEEHTSELQSLMRISYAVFCLKKKKEIVAVSTQAHTY